MSSGFVFSEKPIAIERGEGVHLVSEDGTSYLDAGASYACTPAGHCHPDVVEAVQEQAAELLYVQGSYPVEARTALREKLAAIAPGDLSNVWLCNSGTEANEAALKFARSATGKTKIVAAKRAFHGRTAGTLSATWKPKYRKPFEPLLEDVEFVAYGDREELAEAVDDDTAAVILEPVQGEGGVHPAPEGYLAAAREATDEAGAALIFDEIQTGVGRTGTFWACENEAIAGGANDVGDENGAGDVGVVPDILTSAKGLASGLPLGATLCADWIVDGAGPHGSTFSGNPVVCAAANATLDVLEREDLAANAADVGEGLRSSLADADLPIRDVRGEGLMIGLEVKRGANRVLRDLALDHRVLALPAGRSVVRLLPPLTLAEDDADRIVDALTETLAPTAES